MVNFPEFCSRDHEVIGIAGRECPVCTLRNAFFVRIDAYEDALREISGGVGSGEAMREIASTALGRLQRHHEGAFNTKVAALTIEIIKLREMLTRVLPYIEDGAAHGDEAVEFIDDLRKVLGTAG